jgi:hypothetical protein
MDKATFNERLESEIFAGPAPLDYQKLFGLLLAGLSLQELVRTAARREEELTMVHRGDEDLGYWEISLGSCAVTGPDILGVADEVQNLIFEAESETIGPAGSPM